jgi:hypothetical protein
MLNSKHKKIIKNSSVMIATPMYGGLCTEQYFLGMTKLVAICVELKLRCQVKTIGGESLVSKARNELANEFLKSDCTHLMWIDADTRFEAESVLELLLLNKDAVTGLVPHKKIHWDRVKSFIDKVDDTTKLSKEDLRMLGNQYAFVGHETKSLDTKKLFEIKHAGNAFLMTKRKVYEDYLKTFPELQYLDYRKDNLNSNEAPIEKFAFFDTAICEEHKHYLSEDYFFSLNLRKMGYKVWACPWIKLGHVGSNVYEGNLGRLGELTNVRLS